jgi:hypothetical protein
VTAVFSANYNAIMLRILVISLFVANVLLAGFQASKKPSGKEVATGSVETINSNVPTIHLFSELMQDQGLMDGNRRCFTLGPFHSSEDMDEVLLRLPDVSAGIQDRETQALVEKGYWVFLPPYESLLEANKVLLSLQALGLKDIGVIYNGEHKNSISLGYFLRQENALKRKHGLESRGYKPSMRVQRQAESRYWLDYEQLPGSALLALDMQNRPNDFMQRAMPCPELPRVEVNEPEAGPLAGSEAPDELDPVDDSEGLESERRENNG